MIKAALRTSSLRSPAILIPRPRHVLQLRASAVDSSCGFASLPPPPSNPHDGTQTRTEPPRIPEEPTPTNADVDHIAQVRERITKLSENTAIALRERVDRHTANLATTFSHLGKELNRITGYGEIEQLKSRVAEQEARITDARRAAREAKEAYDVAVRQRASSQREVNDLLQRKSNWTDEDVGRFTSLVRQDHLHEQEESRAKATATQSEDAVEREFSELMRVILNRYHEEQAWSDKIRSASTYGSLAALGVNMLVFILAIVLVEPWKRRRLAQTFEHKVEQMSAENAAALERTTDVLTLRMEGQERILTQIMEGVHYASHVPKADVLAQASGEGVPQPGTDQEPIPPVLQSKRELAVAVAASVGAGILGWLARSWFG
ncbi:Mdm33 family-domain-containing protein [Amylocystis lapponica]|nr:Mdm33 family-domain-containing protein [Amylocystis lapponica]